MNRALLISACCAVFVDSSAAEEKVVYVGLQPKANQKLSEDFSELTEGNSLSEVPKGEQTLAGVKFKIADGLIQLGSDAKPERPRKVEGIAVNRAFKRLHLLQATEFGGSDDNNPIDEGATIAKYIVRYADGSTETIPVVFGKDVRDWWYSDDSKGVSRGKVAWTGTNAYAAQYGAKIRLYSGVWQNPKPDEKVIGIDFVQPGETNAAPFCVAMTIETE